MIFFHIFFDFGLAGTKNVPLYIAIYASCGSSEGRLERNVLSKEDRMSFKKKMKGVLVFKKVYEKIQREVVSGLEKKRTYSH